MRLAYAERFGLEPHLVNPPLKWWARLGVLDGARADREAYEAVLSQGLGKVNAATRERYNALMIAIKLNG